MKTEMLLGLLVPVVFVFFLVVERLVSARRFPPVPRWGLTGATFFVLSLLVGGLMPELMPVQWLQQHSLWDLSGAGLAALPIALLVTTFVGYWLHRAEHKFVWLWRITHQLHHSAERVDMLGAYFTHPLEVVFKVSVSTLIASWGLGVTPMTASAVGVIVALLSQFQHLNVNTPQWLGFIVQRPESHCVHHQRNVEGRNFSELPLWDLLFGTFSNPKTFTGDVGLDTTGDWRLTDLLLMRFAPQGQKS